MNPLLCLLSASLLLNLGCSHLASVNQKFIQKNVKTQDEPTAINPGKQTYSNDKSGLKFMYQTQITSYENQIQNVNFMIEGARQRIISLNYLDAESRRAQSISIESEISGLEAQKMSLEAMKMHSESLLQSTQ